MAREGLLNVVEINHDERSERYVSVTPLSLEALIAEHRRAMPPRIAHWGVLDPEHYRVVEPALRRDEASDFVERYVEVMRQSGWRTILDLPAVLLELVDRFLGPLRTESAQGDAGSALLRVL